MKSQISPGMIIGAIAAVVVLVGCIYFVAGKSGAGSQEGTQPPGMPADAQKEFQQRMAGSPSGSTAPGAAGARPGGAGGTTAPMPGAGGMTAPMTGPGGR